MEEKNFKKYFFWASLLIISVIAYFIVKDFLIPIISAFVLAYLLMPLHRLLKKVMPTKISAILSILIIILLIVIPSYFLIKILVNQVINIATEENIKRAYDFLSRIEIPEKFLEYLPDIANKVSSYSFSLIYSILKYIPTLIINMIITVFLTFCFLSEWERINKEIKSIIPFKNKNKIIKDFSDTAHNIVFGNLLIAIIEFIIALIGLYFIGIKYHIIFASLIAVFALIPLIGPGFVWVPLAIVQLIQRDYLAALLILVLGIILSFGVDFFLRTIVIGKKAKMHPAIILLGVLGGVKLFGIFGFIIGPLILGFFINFIKAALENKK